MSDRDEIDWIEKYEPWRLKDTKMKKLNFTEQELYDLTKAEQIKILKSKGITDIPQYEKGRVEKIINIIKGGN